MPISLCHSSEKYLSGGSQTDWTLLAAAFYRLRAVRGPQNCTQGGGVRKEPKGSPKRLWKVWRESGGSPRESRGSPEGVRKESGGSAEGVLGSPEGDRKESRRSPESLEEDWRESAGVRRQ